VYLERVPAFADVPVIQGAPLVKAIAPQGMLEGPSDPLFSTLIPESRCVCVWGGAAAGLSVLCVELTDRSTLHRRAPTFSALASSPVGPPPAFPSAFLLPSTLPPTLPPTNHFTSHPLHLLPPHTPPPQHQGAVQVHRHGGHPHT
jgi:hypothetical protein